MPFPGSLLPAESTEELCDLGTAERVVLTVPCSPGSSGALLPKAPLSVLSREWPSCGANPAPPAQQSALLSPCWATHFRPVPGVWKCTVLSALFVHKLFSCKNCQG